jgi:hypothetical protein
LDISPLIEHEFDSRFRVGRNFVEKLAAPGERD